MDDKQNWKNTLQGLTEQAKEELITKIDAELPQTQCEQCGYPGCFAYATAIVEGEADYNRCPPGGEPVLKALANLLNRELIPLDTSLGEYKPPQIVRIDESLCIGCVKCIQACPVDAIVGSRRFMHQVIADECTGCELCIPPCPMDCIEIVPLPNDINPQTQIGLNEREKKRAQQSRARFNAKKERESEREIISATQLPSAEETLADPTSKSEMLSLIELAKKKFNE